MEDKLADLYIDITARTDKMKADLAKAKTEIDSVGAKMEEAGTKGGKAMGAGFGALAAPAIIAAGIIVVTAVAQMVRGTMEYGRALTLMSEKTGLGTTFLQNMGYAAQMTGGDLNDINSISMKLTQTIAKAGDGNKAAIKSLADLGLSYDLLKAKTPEEQFRMIFDAIAKIPDPIERAAAAQTTLGSASFLPLIEQYRKLEEESKKLGFMTPEQVEQANQAQLTMDKLAASWKVFTDALSLLIIPNLTPLVDGLNAVVGALKWLVDEYNKLPAPLRALLGAVGINTLGGMNAIREMKGTKGTKPPTAYGSGGIVTRPELAMVGEAGPEAIIPLDRLAGMGGNSVTVNVGNYMGDEISKRALVRDIQRILNEENRRSTHKPTETNFYSVGGHL